MCEWGGQRRLPPIHDRAASYFVPSQHANQGNAGPSEKRLSLVLATDGSVFENPFQRLLRGNAAHSTTGNDARAAAGNVAVQ